MKNTLLFFVCNFLIFSTNAQIVQGQQMIGGQFAFNNQHTASNAVDPTSNSNFVVAAFSLSKFVTPNTIKGFGLNYSYGDNASSSITYSFGAFYNYSKLEALAKRFYISFGGTAAINYSETKYAPSIYSNTINQTSLIPSISLDLGLLYQLNNRFLATANLVNLANLSYRINNTQFNQPGTTIQYSTKSNTFNLNTGLNGLSLNNISIGFRYLLKKQN
jgi:hypothetical protein